MCDGPLLTILWWCVCRKFDPCKPWQGLASSPKKLDIGTEGGHMVVAPFDSFTSLCERTWFLLDLLSSSIDKPLLQLLSSSGRCQEFNVCTQSVTSDSHSHLLHQCGLAWRKHTECLFWTGGWSFGKLQSMPLHRHLHTNYTSVEAISYHRRW